MLLVNSCHKKLKKRKDDVIAQIIFEREATPAIQLLLSLNITRLDTPPYSPTTKSSAYLSLEHSIHVIPNNSSSDLIQKIPYVNTPPYPSTTPQPIPQAKIQTTQIRLL